RHQRRPPMKRPVLVFVLVGLATCVLICTGGVLFIGTLLYHRFDERRAYVQQYKSERQKEAEKELEDIALPKVQTAPLEERGGTVVDVYLKSNGPLMVRGRDRQLSEDLTTESELKYLLIKEKQAGASYVILRADRSVDFKPVQRVR